MAAVAFGLLACQEDRLDTYSGTDNYYFSFANKNGRGQSGTDPWSGSAVDSTSLSIIHADGVARDSVIKIPVTLMGAPVSHVRAITGEGVVDATTTAVPGEDYEVMPSEIPADSMNGFLNVKLINSQRLTDAGADGLKLKVRLTANSDLGTEYTTLNDPAAAADTVRKMNALTFKVIYNNATRMSLLWTSTNLQLSTFKGLFGEWSSAKQALIISLTELGNETTPAAEYWDPPTAEFVWLQRRAGFSMSTTPFENVSAGMLTTAWTYYIYQLCGLPDGVMNTSARTYATLRAVNKALNAYKNSHGGQPMLDENGEEIKLGTTGQTYI